MAPRTFRIEGYEDDGTLVLPDREELGELLGDLIGSIARLGGMFAVAAHRQEISEGHFETTAYIVTHDTHSPAAKLNPPARKPDTEPAKDEAASAPV